MLYLLDANVLIDAHRDYYPLGRVPEFWDWLIDAPTRRIGTDEPDWVFRLRKVCLHAVAISKCPVNVDGVQVMTTELRAAYEQMDAVWKCLPDEFRFDEDDTWWANEARGRLADYNHPTTISLVLSLAGGGFADPEAPESYLRLAVWLGRLGCGYGLAVACLARVLGTKGDIDASLQAVLRDMR
ncbi:MAG: DUF4411 family protein [Acidobacteria bacterium]|nr:DUF4411 family protein [Acidobacteriota bacterium]